MSCLSDESLKIVNFKFCIDYLCIMKYQLGDKVLVLHSNEEGEVVDIINDKMVLIDVDGVRFPVYMDQIDFPYFKRFSEKKHPSAVPGLKRKRIKFILMI